VRKQTAFDLRKQRFSHEHSVPDGEKVQLKYTDELQDRHQQVIFNRRAVKVAWVFCDGNRSQGYWYRGVAGCRSCQNEWPGSAIG